MEKPNKRSMSAIDVAIEQENDGIRFYKEAVGKCKHPLGKAMFQSFIEDEKDHLKRLRILQMTESVSPVTEGIETTHSVAKGRLISVFNEMKDELTSAIRPEIDDMEAIKLAINIEKNGFKLYESECENSTNPRERELYKFLAREENIHLQILKNTYDYLDNLDKWRAREDDRIYDLWVRMINNI